jgi:hypothetical protein
MRIVLADRIGSVLRWSLVVALVGVFLVATRGPVGVITFGSVGLMMAGLWRVGRLGLEAKTPSSFCLPGFRESLRRRYVHAAMLMGLSGALLEVELSLSFPRHEVAGSGALIQICLQVAGGFFVGMGGVLVLGTFRLILSELAWNILMLLRIPLSAAAFVAFVVFIEYSVVTIPVGAAICAFVWVRFQDMICLKRGHRRVIEDALEQGHEAAIENGRMPRAYSKDTVTVPAWAERLFRGWMQRRPYLSAGRYIWGTLYTAFGPWFSYWESILFGLAAAALVLGLLGNKVAPMIALISVVFAYGVIRLPVASTLLLPGGRREKCYATFAAALAASALLLGAAVLVVVLARVGALLVSAAFPEGADRLPHEAMGLAGILLPFVLVPTTLGIQLRREEGGWMTSLVLILSIASLFVFIFWRSTWPDWWGPALLAAMFVFGWVFFLFSLRAACRWRDMG